MSRKIILMVILALTFLTGCNKEAPKSDTTVFVSILPQKYFMDRITGGEIHTEVMVLPGSSPAFYEPSPQQMSKLTISKAFYSIGVPFEQSWLPNIKKNYPHLKVVDTTKGIPKRLNDRPIEFVEDEGEHHEEHDHGRYDPHVWLDPDYAQSISEQMMLSLCEIYPKNAEKYKAGYAKLNSDMEQLKSYLQDKLENSESKKLLVFHPSWGYLADRYGFKQIPIEVDSKNPTARETARIIDYARVNKIRYIFINKQVDTSQAEKIAQEIGAEMISIDPLAENYIDNLRMIGDVISKSIGNNDK